MAFKKLFYCTSLALLLSFGFCVFNANARTLQEASMRERHEQWTVQHGKVYKDSYEKELRYRIFKQNVERIEVFNNAANKPYMLGINQFADLTNEEFKTKHKGKGDYSTITRTPTFYKYENVTKVPVSVDWRQKGAVTPVMNQHLCESCWAFSAVAALEGLAKLSTGKLLTLSAQELVDCAINGENKGCEGGLMDDAFEYVMQNKGLTTEDTYPYQGLEGICNTTAEANHAFSIKGYEDVPANNERALLKVVANQPVSIGIDGSGFEFQFYAGGVFTGPCGTNLDHAVTGVGYGISDDGTRYWLMKNSWGTSWGEEGYIRMQRNVTAEQGLCGIAMLASYPTT